MIDIKLLRENPEDVKKNVAHRGKPSYVQLVEELYQADKKWRELKQEIDDLRHKRNFFSQEINQAKKEHKNVDALLQQVKEIPQHLAEREERLALLEKQTHELLFAVPNLLHSSVPSGKDSADNKVLRSWGRPKSFSYPLQNHAELAELFGIADFDAGRSVAGQGFNYLMGKLALLDLALQRYGIDFLKEEGFMPVIPPLLLNRETLSGAVDLSAFEQVIYKVENEDLYLIGTAEHSLVSMMKGKILQTLPLKVCAVTPCFRKEIGGHGVDTKGLFRMHQFNKVEQVIFAKPEESFKLLEYMQRLTEKFFKSLKIPFRVVEICSGDLGAKFAKQYDIEAWFPRQGEYREATSAGNCTDYQTRRLNIRYEENGERKYVHILNNTMVATSRAMVAILENYQQKDGSVVIPQVLQKYTRFKKIEKVEK